MVAEEDPTSRSSLNLRLHWMFNLTVVLVALLEGAGLGITSRHVSDWITLLAAFLFLIATLMAFCCGLILGATGHIERTDSEDLS